MIDSRTGSSGFFSKDYVQKALPFPTGLSDFELRQIAQNVGQRSTMNVLFVLPGRSPHYSAPIIIENVRLGVRQALDKLGQTHKVTIAEKFMTIDFDGPIVNKRDLHMPSIICSDLIVADVTDQHPGVFMVLAIALVWQKRCVLLRRRANVTTVLPVEGMPIIRYDKASDLAKSEDFIDQVAESLTRIINERASEFPSDVAREELSNIRWTDEILKMLDSLVGGGTVAAPLVDLRREFARIDQEISTAVGRNDPLDAHWFITAARFDSDSIDDRLTAEVAAALLREIVAAHRQERPRASGANVLRTSFASREWNFALPRSLVLQELSLLFGEQRELDRLRALAADARLLIDARLDSTLDYLGALLRALTVAPVEFIAHFLQSLTHLKPGSAVFKYFSDSVPVDLRSPVIQIRRIEAVEPQISTAKRRPSKQILFLSPGANDIDVNRESRELMTYIDRAGMGSEFNVVKEVAARLEDLRFALKRYEPVIVHFAGHGTPRGITFRDRDERIYVVDKRELQTMFEDARSVRLVFLNACYSKAHAAALTARVDCAVGMSALVEDDTAIQFATQFYAEIAGGASVAMAFNAAKAVIRKYASRGTNRPQILLRNGVDPRAMYFVER